MNEFPLADLRHLEAAEGWLGLGDPASAGEELEAIAEPLRGHPAVLHLRWEVYSATRQWLPALEVAATLTRLEPADLGGWLHRSFALHELKRTLEARDNLLPVVDRFPDNAVLRYNLGCYECQLGNLETACGWLRRAFALPGGTELRASAPTDPDLAPLRPQLGQL